MKKFKDLAKEIREKEFIPLPKNYVYDDGFDDFLKNINNEICKNGCIFQNKVGEK